MDTERTIFQDIIEKKIPADIVFETNDVLAFLDIAPVAKGHTLVIPKHPVQDIFSLSDSDAAHLMQAIVTISRAVRTATKAPSVNVISNNGFEAGQEVLHLHFHIIPRVRRGEFQPLPHTTYADSEESASFAKAIHDAC
ncbi:MAG: HIT domain-containing protein [Candidatus Kaiserbacteria bacterium]|nr:HIT domain-containing protein [Candidatus Kaiserbacteria bacterium]